MIGWRNSKITMMYSVDFRSNMSTYHTLLELVEEIKNALDKKYAIY